MQAHCVIPHIKMPNGMNRTRLSDIERFESGHTDRTSENEIWFSDKQLAERFQISTQTLWRWRKAAAEAEAAEGVRNEVA